MRIIAGQWRGRPLEAPTGNTTRLTSHRAREGLFSMLASRLGSFEDLAVADLFAGTGALGLAALSRGAAHCTFAEKDRTALAALRANIVATREEKSASIIAGDALHPPRAAAPCSLAFLDPPYGEDLAPPALAALAAAGWLAPDALAVAEVAAKEKLSPPTGFTLLEERRYGAARIVFLRYEGK